MQGVLHSDEEYSVGCGRMEREAAGGEHESKRLGVLFGGAGKQDSGGGGVVPRQGGVHAGTWEGGTVLVGHTHQGRRVAVGKC